MRLCSGGGGHRCGSGGGGGCGHRCGSSGGGGGGSNRL